MKLLLDTNAYSAMRDGDAKVGNLIRRAESVLMSAIVVGELLQGFHNGTRYVRNVDELDEFLKIPQVTFLPVTRGTCIRYGLVASALRRAGKPIPTNDVWIAAHAVDAAATLLSQDAHFDSVAGLDRIRW